MTLELGKGFSQRNLRNMRQLYNVVNDLKWQTVSAKLTYSHYCEIIWFDKSKINYYINISENYNLSVRQLRERIKSNEYERLPEEAKSKLVNKETFEIKDTIKNPIIIRNNSNDIITEKLLQKIILEDISSFLKELGNGFTFIKNEYKIKIGDRYNYINLLLFNIEFNCYVVVELKITELKKEYIGQIEVYMNYIDNNIKKIYHDKTIGIIICKKDNMFILEYCSDKRILSREFILV